MKKLTLILGLHALTLLMVSGCSQSDKTSEQTPAQEVKEQYQCPMKCSEEKFDKAGKCPVCGMDLEKVAAG
jgi:Cu2+-exporting ATPase